MPGNYIVGQPDVNNNDRIAAIGRRDLYRLHARNYSTRRMPVSNTNTDSLLFGKDERGYFITARGNIRANLCFPLREGLLARLDKDRAPPAVFADLSQCDYMDSTFIGLMVAIDKRLKSISAGDSISFARPRRVVRSWLRSAFCRTSS